MQARGRFTEPCSCSQLQAMYQQRPSRHAGKGAVYTAGGTHELEACIMDSELRCGAACLLKRVRNPILLARRVMEATPHTFLGADAAEEFAESQARRWHPSILDYLWN
jgi:L-asparaginase / beta-aspartyl-peptidase